MENVQNLELTATIKPAKSSKWPKRVMPLTPEQQRIKDDFFQYWLGVLRNRYSYFESFNHGFPAKNSRKGGRVMEIGSGLGEHIAYEDLADTEYYALEKRDTLANVIREKFPQVHVIQADCQDTLDFPDGYFDKILAIHVLEHLPNLPATIREAYRLLKADGEFCVVIPCEGGLAYSLGRELSAKPLFVKRYGVCYDMFIKTEHINMPHEVLEELNPYFEIKKKSFFPFWIPLINLNLAIGLILRPKNM